MDKDFCLKKLAEEMRLRNYSPRSVRAYVQAVGGFFRVCGVEAVFEPDCVRGFLLYLEGKKYCSSTINLHLQAIKFVCRYVLSRKLILSVVWC